MYDPTGHQPGAVPSRVLTALRGETKRLDAPTSPSVVRVGGNTEAAPADLATGPSPDRRALLFSDTLNVPAGHIYAPLSPAERAQDRAEACLTDLTAAMLSRGSDPAAHAQRMAVATHAAAQALLSAYVLWRAEAEAGGHGVPVPPLAPLSAPDSAIVPEACTVEAFADACFVQDPKAVVSFAYAYNAYMAWCMARGWAALTRSSFRAKLGGAGYVFNLISQPEGLLTGVRLIADTAERGA